MADIISFPDEAQRLFRSGEKQLEEGNFLAAKKIFRQLYEKNPAPLYADKLIECLVGSGEYAAALELFAEQGFIEEEEGFSKYVHLLMLDGQFLACHQLLQKNEDPQLLSELKQLERVSQLLDPGNFQMKEQQLAKFDQDLPPIRQKDWQDFIHHLTRADFLKLCRSYLPKAKNPFIPPKLFEELVASGAKGKISYNGKTIELGSLPLPENAQVLKEVLQVVEEECQDQPQLLDLILPEIQAHFALMYPQLPPLETAFDWAQSYLLEYQALFADESASSELEKYREIQAEKDRLRLIYQKLNDQK